MNMNSHKYLKKAGEHMKRATLSKHMKIYLTEDIV